MNLHVRFIVHDKDKHKHKSEWYRISPDALKECVTDVDKSES
jgi:hypothetical protein